MQHVRLHAPALIACLLAAFVAAACTATQDLGTTGGNAADAGNPAASVESWCTAWEQASRNRRDGGPTTPCPENDRQEYTCYKQLLKPDVATAALNCNVQLPYGEDMPKCISAASPPTADDVSFRQSCEELATSCSGSGTPLSKDYCRLAPLSAMNAALQNTYRSCLTKPSCGESKTCFKASLDAVMCEI